MGVKIQTTPTELREEITCNRIRGIECSNNQVDRTFCCRPMAKKLLKTPIFKYPPRQGPTLYANMGNITSNPKRYPIGRCTKIPNITFLTSKVGLCEINHHKTLPHRLTVQVEEQHEQRHHFFKHLFLGNGTCYGHAVFTVGFIIKFHMGSEFIFIFRRRGTPPPSPVKVFTPGETCKVGVRIVKIFLVSSQFYPLNSNILMPVPYSD